MKFNESLKIMRSEIGMTQLELANALDVNKRTVSRWEAGMVAPHVGTINEILDIAKKRGVSKRCLRNLQAAVQAERTKVLRVSKSRLYPVDKESICDLVDDSHNAIFVSDLETDEILYANREAERYAGHRFTPGEMCYHFMYGRELPCQSCPKERMIEDESTNYHTVSVKNGRHYLFRGHKLKWNGRPAHAEYFFEEKIDLEAADGFRALVDELDIGVCTYWVHDDGHIEINYMSDGYFAIVGSTRAKRTQYAGHGVMNAVYDEDKHRVKETALAAGKAQQSVRMRYRVMLDDGSLKEMYMRAKFIKREKNKSLFYCTVEDIDCGFNYQPGGKENGI